MTEDMHEERLHAVEAFSNSFVSSNYFIQFLVLQCHLIDYYCGGSSQTNFLCGLVGAY